MPVGSAGSSNASDCCDKPTPAFSAGVSHLRSLRRSADHYVSYAGGRTSAD